MFNFNVTKEEQEATWDSFDACGVTLDLTILLVDNRGVLTFYKFDVPYGWLQRKLRDEYNTKYGEFQRQDNYFDKANKIYEDAKELGIIKDFRLAC